MTLVSSRNAGALAGRRRRRERPEPRRRVPAEAVEDQARDLGQGADPDREASTRRAEP